MTLGSEIGSTWAEFSSRTDKESIFDVWANRGWIARDWRNSVGSETSKICYTPDQKLGVKYPPGTCTLPNLLIEAAISNQYFAKCGGTGCNLESLITFFAHNAVWRAKSGNVDAAADALIKAAETGAQNGYFVGSSEFSAAVERMLNRSGGLGSLTQPWTWGNNTAIVSASSTVLVDAFILADRNNWYLTSQ